jgi:hypothetical protein
MGGDGAFSPSRLASYGISAYKRAPSRLRHVYHVFRAAAPSRFGPLIAAKDRHPRATWIVRLLIMSY